MRKLIPLLLIILLGSCSPARKSQTGSSSNTESSPGTTVIASADKDGSSYEKAIVIKAKNSTNGIAAEYKWLKENYPGYTLIKQSLDMQGNHRYDIMHIKTKNGDEKNIYFDITNFFGKW